MERKERMFLYAVIKHSKPRNPRSAAEVAEPEEPAVFVIEPTWTLAADEETVKMIAIRKIPEAYMQDLARLEVAIRPF